MIVFFYPFGIYYTKVLYRMDKLRYMISRLVTRHRVLARWDPSNYLKMSLYWQNVYYNVNYCITNWTLYHYILKLIVS